MYKTIFQETKTELLITKNYFAIINSNNISTYDVVKLYMEKNS